MLVTTKKEKQYSVGLSDIFSLVLMVVIGDKYLVIAVYNTLHIPCIWIIPIK